MDDNKWRRDTVDAWRIKYTDSDSDSNSDDKDDGSTSEQIVFKA